MTLEACFYCPFVTWVSAADDSTDEPQPNCDPPMGECPVETWVSAADDSTDEPQPNCDPPMGECPAEIPQM